MSYPPVLPPNNRTNATDMVNAHAADHNALVDALTNMPWGRVATIENKGASQGNITTVTDVLGTSLTWTRRADRKYHLRYAYTIQQAGAAATHNIGLYLADNTMLFNPGGYCGIGYLSLAVDIDVSGPAGTLTYKLRASTGAGVLTVLNTALNATVIYIDDVGPA